MKLSAKNTFFSLLVILIFTSCARNPVTGSKEFMLMSEGQEMALGKQSDPSIVAQYGLYDDKVMQDFINEKGKQMGKISHRPDIDYQFRILDSPVVNAFAVPGGYVYFTRGIMAHFNNEAEFAGVLGHEIGHITARHSAKQYSTQMIGQLGLMAGVIASEDFRQFAQEASQGLGLLFLKFGRDHESQSDELGVVYSTTIGYDSHEMADFFNTLNRLSGDAGSSIPDFMSTHPNPIDRYNKVHQMSDVAQSVVDKKALKINRKEYLRMIDGLVYGEDPKQGYAENNYFYHPELRFQFPYPQGWRLSNSPQQIQMVPEDGKALMLMTLSAEKTLDAAAQAAVEQFKLTVSESRRTNVNGFNAIAMVSDQVPTDQQGNQTGEAIRLLTYFIQYNDFIYIFHGISSQNDFNRYLNQFKQTMSNFKELRDPSKINVVATRIKIQEAKSSGSFQQVMSGLGVISDDMEELSIVNGMLMNDNVSKGTLLKTFSQPHNRPISQSSGSNNTIPSSTSTNDNNSGTNSDSNNDSNNQPGKIGTIGKPSGTTTGGSGTKVDKKTGGNTTGDQSQPQTTESTPNTGSTSGTLGKIIKPNSSSTDTTNTKTKTKKKKSGN